MEGRGGHEKELKADSQVLTFALGFIHVRAVTKFPLMLIFIPTGPLDCNLEPHGTHTARAGYVFMLYQMIGALNTNFALSRAAISDLIPPGYRSLP